MFSILVTLILLVSVFLALSIFTLFLLGRLYRGQQTLIENQKALSIRSVRDKSGFRSELDNTHLIPKLRL